MKLIESEYYDYLRIEVAQRLVDRLDDIRRKFPLALDLGCHRGHIYKLLNDNKDIGGIQKLIQCDLSANAIDTAKKNNQYGSLETEYVVGDEEDMHFSKHQFDIVLSSGCMHWVNEIPLVLEKVKNILKPDGAFICSMIGGNSLSELRYCLYLAEQDRKGGMSPVRIIYSYIIDMSTI